MIDRLKRTTQRRRVAGAVWAVNVILLLSLLAFAFR